VATADTAAKAACRLFDRGWSGYHRVGVHGPRDLSSDEAAAIISSALGEPVKCVEATLDQARGAMKGMGMPDFVVEILIEQYAAFREGPLGFGRAAHARHDDPHDARRVRADHARARDPRQALTFAPFTRGEPWGEKPHGSSPRHPRWRSIGLRSSGTRGEAWIPPTERVEILTLDFWSTLEGLEEHYDDSTATVFELNERRQEFAPYRLRLFAADGAHWNLKRLFDCFGHLP
jgi:hypothetical protein